MNLTDSEAQRLLDMSLTGSYLVVLDAGPGETGDLTAEVTDAAYTRSAVTWTVDGAGVWHLDPILMAEAAGTYAVSHFGFASASTGGTLRWYGPLDNPGTITTGTQLDFIGVQVSLS